MECIFPGSFDPLHQGHIEIVEKAQKIFKKIYIVVANNNQKNHTSSLEIRYQVLKEYFNSYKKVKVIICKTKLSNVMKKYKIEYYVRGLRNIVDYEYEIWLWAQYKKEKNNIQLILLPTNKYLHLSSSKIKNLTK